MDQENLYPMMLKLADVPVLVVGGGKVATRKVKSLVGTGAAITVISPHWQDELARFAAAGEIVLHGRPFVESDLKGMRLVYAATDQEQLNQKIAALCQKRGIFVNVADQPAWSTFYVPATARIGAVAVSVSTGGKSPLLDRRLRELLEQRLNPDFGEMAMELGKLRELLQERVAGQDRRQRLLERLLTPELIRAVQDGEGNWRTLLQAAIDRLAE